MKRSKQQPTGKTTIAVQWMQSSLCWQWWNYWGWHESPMIRGKLFLGYSVDLSVKALRKKH